MKVQTQRPRSASDGTLPPALTGEGNTLPEFVGRKDVLRQYREWIQTIRNGEHTRVISNLHGLTGMGKTWLTCELYQAVSSEPGFHAAWMSFETSMPLPESFCCWQPMKASQALLESWKRSYHPAEVLELDPIFDEYDVRWCGSPDVLDSPDSAPTPDFFVLIIDAINQLESGGKPVWEQLQKQVIEPLVNSQQSNLLIVCISQAPLRWDDWVLRERALAAPRLQALTLEETRSLLARYHLEASSELIFSLTFGHPAAINYIITTPLWEKLGIPDSRFTPPERLPPEPPLDEEIQKRTEKLSTPLEQEVFWLAGLLRQVDLQTIKHLLETIPFEQPIEASMGKLIQAVKTYREVGLLVPDTTFCPLTFPQEARMMVLDTMRSSNIERYQQVCDVLCGWYETELRRLPVKNERYFPEWIYFSLQLLALAQAEEPISEEEAAENQWLERLQGLWQIRKKNENDALRQRIYTDWEVRELLYRVNITTTALRDIIGVPQTEINQHLEEYRPEYRQEIINYLFNYRFPRTPSEDERELLKRIANEFPKGFDAKMLEKHIRILQKDLSEKTIRRQVLRYISQFNEIHVITYNQEKRLYVMDDWIRKFLTEDQQEAALVL